MAQSYLDQAVRIDPEEILVGDVDDDVEDDVDDVDVEDDDGDGDGDDNNQLTMSDQLISDFDFLSSKILTSIPIQEPIPK